MKTEKYEKPEMIFKELRLSENVANTCWGLKPGHPQDEEFYYDVDGEGYVGFHVQSASGNCGAPDAYNILYYEYNGAEGDPVKGSYYETFLERVLAEKGGNNGQPYQGITNDFPVNPDPSWS